MQSQANQRLDMIAEQIGGAKENNLIIYQSNGNALSVTLNRPKALNSLNLDMIRDLSNHIADCNKHQIVWYEGAGGKALCAGGDVKALYSQGATVNDRLTFFGEEFILDYRTSQLSAIQISSWDGIIMGGGVGLTVNSPFIIATQKTLFAMPEAKLGFFTDVGVNYTLSRMRNNIGYYLGLTGSRLKGQEAYIAGLANYFIKSQNIPKVKKQLLEAFDKKVQNPKQKVQEILKKYHEPSNKKQLQNQGEIKALFGLKSAKDIYVLALKQNTKFSNQVVKLLEEQCPVSLQLIFRLITMGKKQTLRDCFIHDFQIIEHIVRSHDFAEGVRTVLIQKNAKPKWSRQTLSAVQQEDVLRFLKPHQQSKPLNI